MIEKVMKLSTHSGAWETWIPTLGGSPSPVYLVEFPGVKPLGNWFIQCLDWENLIRLSEKLASFGIMGTQLRVPLSNSIS